MNRNIIGTRYGQLEVIRPHKRIKSDLTNKWISYVICKCHKCGNEESIQQSLLTGKVMRACTKCQLDRNRPSTNNVKPTRNKKPNMCNINRNTLSGFTTYFTAFPAMFESTFNLPCTQENIKKEFAKLQIES